MKIAPFFFLLLAHLSMAQSIRYAVSFPNAIHHEAEISLTVNQLPKHPAIFRMSRSSPGRYATHEFGKNVYNVRAVDEQNQPLTVTRIDGDVYSVANHKGTVTLSYTLFGNYPDGTYMGIDPQSIHLNIPATFMWIKGFDQRPIEVKFNLPADNMGVVATQLVPTADRFTYTAPGLQYFMDSPIKIGKLAIKEWQRSNTDGKSITFRVALEAAVPDSTADGFAKKISRIVDQAKAVYGEFPNYDYGTYTFLASLNPYVRGDGMEHRNSTMIAVPIAFTGPERVLGVFAHEFFHGWNVERIRPKTLEPFNFEKSNMSYELWFAEGFTQYYGELLLVRAGFTPVDSYMNTLTGIISGKQLTPGGTYFSPIDASCHAVFVDAGVSIDRTNYANMFTSYYTYGAAVALALDLELRQRNLSLDAYMQAVWQRFGKTEQPYTVDGLQSELGKLTTPDFARQFFSKYIYGHEAVDYASLLTKAGVALKKAQEGKAWFGNVRYGETDKGLTLLTSTIRDTPLYKSGLDIDDVITSLAGQSVTKTADISTILNQHKPGETLQIAYLHRGEPKTASVTLAENPAISVQLYENASLSLTPAMQTFRDSWLGAKSVK
ncbi:MULTISPECIES: PDZ domain-containing protein [unclassified Spirosoma]|uniref:M61 family metallopeptidase n=1 Tax=unclassified Spirosoma TaxID=2621999 RepID=UPI00095AA98A|nr:MULTISPECIES: PDZ domain-containing protein [unclassified Spirosoma]MBN8826051.1 M61 family metallopeptidase [Spirosoma sp.]OJW75504.1 MAG: peptidase M61 [Spirosoma sp. 48-14]